MAVTCYRCNCWPCECRDGIALIHGDCVEVMAALEAESITAVVTDPPYGLGFMGKGWDHGIPGVPFWKAVLRVAKPGCHMLAFGGTRTHHRLMCAIEDAGWDVRDCLGWIYGSGFPKTLNVSKAIDKAAGAERIRGNRKVFADGTKARNSKQRAEGWQRPFMEDGNWQGQYETAPATEAAKQWDGWGTSLKPAWEPVVLSRKPLSGTVAANCTEYGAGALWVDGCRIEGHNPSIDLRKSAAKSGKAGMDMHSSNRVKCGLPAFSKDLAQYVEGHDGEKLGRWPANLIHDGSEEVVRVFTVGKADKDFTANSGSAARFFYCAKASNGERGNGNSHPTVKPLGLMSYLCKLLSQPGHKGTLLDPFAGSGSTLIAGCRWFERVIGIEQNEKYCEIAANRLRQEVLF